MAQIYDEMPDWLVDWLVEQHIFFVATAPLAGDGHVNLSPKALRGTFHIIDSKTVWYEDLTGSGVETIAHLRENKRITIMFTAFDKPPRIARLFGTGRVHEYGTPEYEKLVGDKRQPGSRAVIVVDIQKVGTSSGNAVPFYQFVSERNVLHKWGTQKDALDAQEVRELKADEEPQRGIRSYWKDKNTKSLDGLPGMEIAPFTRDNLPQPVGFEDETLPPGWPPRKPNTDPLALPLAKEEDSPTSWFDIVSVAAHTGVSAPVSFAIGIAAGAGIALAASAARHSL